MTDCWNTLPRVQTETVVVYYSNQRLYRRIGLITNSRKQYRLIPLGRTTGGVINQGEALIREEPI